MTTASFANQQTNIYTHLRTNGVEIRLFFVKFTLLIKPKHRYGVTDVYIDKITGVCLITADAQK